MPKTKEPKPLPPQPTEQEMEDQSLELDSQSLEDQAKKVLKPDIILALKKIAYYTAKVGLPLDEACMLVDIDYEKFKEEMKLQPLIGKIIKMKELQFKKDMLHTLTQKARSGDDKLAQWLLEKKFPEEYGAKKSGGGDNEDIIYEAIQFIRKKGDNNPLVSEVTGKAVVIHKSVDGEQPIIERIDDILNKNNG